MKSNRFTRSGVAVALALAVTPVLAAPPLPSMVEPVKDGWKVSDPLLTIGETFEGTSGALNRTTKGSYTPVGILDGLGAYELDDDDYDDDDRRGRGRDDDDDDEGIVRVFANHELLNTRGYPYEVSDGMGGTFTMTGARISYFDIDKKTRKIVDAGLAYDRIYDANGEIASDTSFLVNLPPNLGNGFSRFCSSQLVEAGTFNRGNSRGTGRARGLEDTIYFAGEEDGGNFNPVGGAEWALDVKTGDFWQLPWLGRGAWENVTLLDTGNASTVAILLADDSSPFDADADGENEAAPLFLYVGKKEPKGNFVERNGLSGGKLYVWVADNGDTTPLEFRGDYGETRSGRWVQVENAPVGEPSEDGSTGYDEYGFPTQRNLWSQAEALGAFGFSRPEDVATNPEDGTEAVLASTGVDTYAVDPATGNGADTFGTTYTVKTDFAKMTADVTIIYDGDADPDRALRSPDNLDWSADGYIYVQEDEAEEDTLSGDEGLFAPPVDPPFVANLNEAGIVRLDPKSGAIVRLANIDRDVVLDASIADPFEAVDVDAGFGGEWESSGILDVSKLFDEKPGTLFIFDVQAHGIEDQDQFNPESRIVDGDLVEGGQLLFLSNKRGKGDDSGKYGDD